MALVFHTIFNCFRASGKLVLRNIRLRIPHVKNVIVFFLLCGLIWQQDYATYWTHRFYHLPFFYKNFHKMHHKYKQPTAFSVTAIHPIEIIHMQLVLFSPVFLYPVHWCKLFYFNFDFALFISN